MQHTLFGANRRQHQHTTHPPNGNPPSEPSHPPRSPAHHQPKQTGDPTNPIGQSFLLFPDP